MCCADMCQRTSCCFSGTGQVPLTNCTRNTHSTVTGARQWVMAALVAHVARTGHGQVLPDIVNKGAASAAAACTAFFTRLWNSGAFAPIRAPEHQHPATTTQPAAACQELRWYQQHCCMDTHTFWAVTDCTPTLQEGSTNWPHQRNCTRAFALLRQHS
eukprot:GHRQ01035229.1.p1 GENE.GHRQ01035229.1~~GHRQ01035229.1.p1  ORF type:complete len:158 (-),score=20.08 GHRQ01035229.1:709-1182(-)